MSHIGSHTHKIGTAGSVEGSESSFPRQQQGQHGVIGVEGSGGRDGDRQQFHALEEEVQAATSTEKISVVKVKKQD